jgi:hypothetical protein
VTTTGRERAADGFGGERAIFLMLLASVAVGKEAVDDTTVRARCVMPLGVRMRMEKVWGELVDYRPSNGGN